MNISGNGCYAQVDKDIAYIVVLVVEENFDPDRTSLTLKSIEKQATKSYQNDTVSYLVNNRKKSSNNEIAFLAFPKFLHKHITIIQSAI